MYTGEKNEKAYTRAEEKGSDTDLDSRRGREVGSESQSFENQQKRINRADCEGRDFVCVGTAITGGMLDNLIDDYANQVTLKQQEIQKLNDDIARSLEEIKKLNFRIQELTSLREKVQQPIEEEQE